MLTKIVGGVLIGLVAYVALTGTSRGVFSDLQGKATSSQHYAEGQLANMADDARCLPFIEEVKAHAIKTPELSAAVTEQIIRTKSAARAAGCIKNH